MTLLTFALGALTQLVLFGLGVLLWRQQLSAKRRFEVAEHVLATFQKASDALSTLRSPMIWAGEIEAAKPKKDEKKDTEEQTADEFPTKSKDQRRRERRIEMHNVYVARAETVSPAFAELRTAQVLAEIHISRVAADAMNVLFRGRREVFAAVSGLYGGPSSDDYWPDEESREHHRQFEVSMRQLLAEHRAEDDTPDETDKLSQRIDAAWATLENACRPILADPSWLTMLRRVGARVHDLLQR